MQFCLSKCFYISLIIRPGSVGVDSVLYFENGTGVPNTTEAVLTLQQEVAQSLVFLDIIPSSIEAGECKFFTEKFTLK